MFRGAVPVLRRGWKLSVNARGIKSSLGEDCRKYMRKDLRDGLKGFRKGLKEDLKEGLNEFSKDLKESLKVSLGDSVGNFVVEHMKNAVKEMNDSLYKNLRDSISKELKDTRTVAVEGDSSSGAGKGKDRLVAFLLKLFKIVTLPLVVTTLLGDVASAILNTHKNAAIVLAAISTAVGYMESSVRQMMKMQLSSEVASPLEIDKWLLASALGT